MTPKRRTRVLSGILSSIMMASTLITPLVEASGNSRPNKRYIHLKESQQQDRTIKIPIKEFLEFQGGKGNKDAIKIYTNGEINSSAEWEEIERDQHSVTIKIKNGKASKVVTNNMAKLKEHTEERIVIGEENAKNEPNSIEYDKDGFKGLLEIQGAPTYTGTGELKESTKKTITDWDTPEYDEGGFKSPPGGLRNSRVEGELTPKDTRQVKDHPYPYYNKDGYIANEGSLKLQPINPNSGEKTRIENHPSRFYIDPITGQQHYLSEVTSGTITGGDKKWVTDQPDAIYDHDDWYGELSGYNSEARKDFKLVKGYHSQYYGPDAEGYEGVLQPEQEIKEELQDIIKYKYIDSHPTSLYDKDHGEEGRYVGYLLRTLPSKFMTYNPTTYNVRREVKYDEKEKAWKTIFKGVDIGSGEIDINFKTAEDLDPNGFGIPMSEAYYNQKPYDGYLREYTVGYGELTEQDYEGITQYETLDGKNIQIKQGELYLDNQPYLKDKNKTYTYITKYQNHTLKGFVKRNDLTPQNTQYKYNQDSTEYNDGKFKGTLQKVFLPLEEERINQEPFKIDLIDTTNLYQKDRHSIEFKEGNKVDINIDLEKERYDLEKVKVLSTKESEILYNKNKHQGKIKDGSMSLVQYTMIFQEKYGIDQWKDVASISSPKATGIDSKTGINNTIDISSIQPETFVEFFTGKNTGNTPSGWTVNGSIADYLSKIPQDQKNTNNFRLKGELVYSGKLTPPTKESVYQESIQGFVHTDEAYDTNVYSGYVQSQDPQKVNIATSFPEATENDEEVIITLVKPNNEFEESILFTTDDLLKQGTLSKYNEPFLIDEGLQTQAVAQSYKGRITTSRLLNDDGTVKMKTESKYIESHPTKDYSDNQGYKSPPEGLTLKSKGQVTPTIPEDVKRNQVFTPQELGLTGSLPSTYEYDKDGYKGTLRLETVSGGYTETSSMKVTGSPNSEEISEIKQGNRQNPTKSDNVVNSSTPGTGDVGVEKKIESSIVSYDIPQSKTESFSTSTTNYQEVLKEFEGKVSELSGTQVSLTDLRDFRENVINSDNKEQRDYIYDALGLEDNTIFVTETKVHAPSNGNWGYKERNEVFITKSLKSPDLNPNDYRNYNYDKIVTDIKIYYKTENESAGENFTISIDGNSTYKQQGIKYTPVSSGELINGGPLGGVPYGPDYLLYSGWLSQPLQVGGNIVKTWVSGASAYWESPELVFNGSSLSVIIHKATPRRVVDRCSTNKNGSTSCTYKTVWDGWKISDSRTWMFEGTVTKRLDTREYKYVGDITRPAIESAIKDDYHGNVYRQVPIKPGESGQTYGGKVYRNDREGELDRYEGWITKDGEDTRLYGGNIFIGGNPKPLYYGTAERPEQDNRRTVYSGEVYSDETDLREFKLKYKGEISEEQEEIWYEYVLEINYLSATVDHPTINAEQKGWTDKPYNVSIEQSNLEDIEKIIYRINNGKIVEVTPDKLPIKNIRLNKNDVIVMKSVSKHPTLKDSEVVRYKADNIDTVKPDYSNSYRSHK